MFSLPDLFSVKGRVALVTGGGTGLGRVCAEALLMAGARVLIASRKAGVCEEAARELSEFGPCEGFGGTVQSEAGVAALADEVRRRTGELHILVNNAGVSWGEPYANYPWKAFDRVMGVNVTGLFQLTRELTPLLLKAATPGRPATIVNLGSVMGIVTQAENAYAYSASKAAVHHLTRIVAAEFAAQHLTVNAIAPGPFPSNMTKFAMGSDEGQAQAAGTVPMGRVGHPADLAGTLLYLTGRAGAYTTGAVIPLDGGLHCAAAPAMFGGAH
jgi:NAD(P)-dependent dehydrogenase (short-subunit alcohol dehydrogenase family)